MLQNSITDPAAPQEAEPNLPPTRPLRRVEIWGGRLAMLGVTAIAMAIAQGTI
ncbi:MAG: hypothetical protein AAF289_11940 [Cyanobacteria bacterium P01_A01_bin.135]